LLDRLCHVTAEVLQSDLSHTFLFDAEQDAFRLVAGCGDTPKPWEALQMLEIPASIVRDAVARLTAEGVLFLHPGASDPLVPRELWSAFGVTGGTMMMLRRGRRVIGVQTAGYRSAGVMFTAKMERLARGLAEIASLALDNARLVEQLEQANELKSEFLATMSHELRTPLTALSGYTELLVDGEFGTVSAEQGATLDHMVDRGKELLGLINTTLDLSRLEAGQVVVDRRRVEIPALFAELDAETQLLRERRRPQLLFTWAVSPDTPALETDPGKVKLVMRNLIDNALKFTDAGGITVSARGRDDGIELAVADTGIGITPDILPIIFECFRQGDASNTRMYSGVGLGLYIARRLLDLLGGTVSVTTAVGAGSTFSVWLPVVPPGVTRATA
jgi:signal transduction histidine kinase